MSEISRTFLFALSLVGVALAYGTASVAQTVPAAAPPGATPAESVSARLDRAYAEYHEALKRYEDAQKRVENGREPLPGERIGLAGGGSRLRPEYFERQDELARNHDAARAKLEEARARWNALR